LRNEIQLGDRQPGDRIPTIEELHLQYDVSQITVRKALVLLEQAELITKKQKKGIFVRKAASRELSHASNSYRDEINRLKKLVRKKIDGKWIKPPPRITVKFKGVEGIYRDQKIFCVRRLWKSKNEKWRRRLTSVYIPAKLYDEIQSPYKEDFVVLLEVFNLKKYKQTTLRATETINPWICDVDSASYLNIPDGTPVFQRTWDIFSQKDELLWTSESLTTAFSIVREVMMANPNRE
jgi:GntR family transcriptional regulator